MPTKPNRDRAYVATIGLSPPRYLQIKFNICGGPMKLTNLTVKPNSKIGLMIRTLQKELEEVLERGTP